MGKIGDSNTTCSVPQCKSRTSEITLFRFPKEEGQRKKWADAMKIESKITPNMQVCSRHFVKSDYITTDNGGAKVKRLKRSAVPSQNLPWQFPNKRVSPTLAKARMERLKNRSMQKVPDSPGNKSETPTKKAEKAKKTDPNKKPESEPNKSESESLEKTEESELIKSEVKSEDDMSTGNVSIGPDSVKDDEIKESDEESDKETGEKASEAKKDDSNVPVGAPTRLSQREHVLKCEYCGRKCLTPQALQTHQHNAHKNARNSLNNAKKDSPLTNKAKSSPKPTLVPLISVKSPENLLANPPTKGKPPASLNSREVEKVLQEDSDYVPTASDSDDSAKEELVEKKFHRRTEFECPKCKRRFAVYFMAYKHIQKHHSGTPNGSKTSNLTLKPIRVEICTICNTTVEGNVHVCVGPLKFAMGYICMGCEQEYKSLPSFDMHKSSMHSDGVESMFFGTLDEFDEWKDKMETQTRVKYAILDQNDKKKIYHCSHRTVLGSGSHSRQRMCPSCVVVQEFAKGFQVHYYPNHYDHSHQKYNLSSAFQKYSITSLMNFTAQQLPDSDEEVLDSPDLYLQFKRLTETLVNEAARINVNGLKKLMRKALDMMEIINSYVEDDDDEVISSNSVLKLDSDKDNLQDEVRLALSSLKRKSEKAHEVTVKKKKSVFQSTENTLKTTKTPVKPTFSHLTNETEVRRKEPLMLNQSPTFIDTFQDFVGKTLTKTDERKKRDMKKAPVKTKIGQFKPKTPPKSPKKVTFSPSPQSLSPKNVKEIEYEVKEQENDCNILILKI